MNQNNYNNLIKRIEIDPEKLAGKPVIKGTRIAVEQILRILGAGVEIKEILTDFPHLKQEDILAALVYASNLVEDFQVYPKEYLRQIKISV